MEHFDPDFPGYDACHKCGAQLIFYHKGSSIEEVYGCPRCDTLLDEEAKSPTSYTNDDLFDADLNCKHEVVSAPGGGVKCTKCPGWFCF